jgi:hypothetical protein
MSTQVMTPALPRTTRVARPSLGSFISVLFIGGLLAGGAGFALLAAGHTGVAQSLFVTDLVAMLGSVSLGAFAPRTAPRSR